MKTRSIIHLIALMLLTSACSPLKNIFIDQLLPANEKFAEDVKRIGVVNRVTQDRAAGVHLDSDFLYLGEMRDGSNSVTDAIVSAFQKSLTFQTILVRDTLSHVSSASMPEALSASTVNDICNSNGIEALVVIEYFKADFSKDVNEAEEEGFDAVTGSATTIFVASLESSFSAGVRVYYKGSVTKEFEYSEVLSFLGKGNTKQDARNNLIKKRQAAETWGNGFGNSFAQQYLPHRYKMLRTMYVGKDKRFKVAKKHVKAAEWSQAETLWKEIVANGDPKFIPMALYNLALYEEVQGDFQGAKTLLSRCISEYKLDQAIFYLRLIEIKINQSSGSQP